MRQPENRWLRNILKKKVQDRCDLFLGDVPSCSRELFSHSIYKWCYGSIARILEVGSWENISVKDFKQQDSQFQLACNLADSWNPTRDVIEKRINALILRRDMGYLPPNQCRALTDYLNTHNIEDGSELLP